jgi:hypothetical protein
MASFKSFSSSPFLSAWASKLFHHVITKNSFTTPILSHVFSKTLFYSRCGSQNCFRHLLYTQLLLLSFFGSSLTILPRIDRHVVAVHWMEPRASISTNHVLTSLSSPMPDIYRGLGTLKMAILAENLENFQRSTWFIAENRSFTLQRLHLSFIY